MRTKLQKLKTALAGQEVFIVGGGYSVKQVNWEFLQDKLTVAINDAYLFLPDTSALFWCDDSWVGRNKDKLDQHPCDLRFYARFNGQRHVELDISGPCASTILFRSGEMGFDPNPDNVKGNNSGALCLNLVLNMSPKRVYLVGFDMRDNPLKPGEVNFHNNHIHPGKPSVYQDSFIPAMDELAREIERLRLDVDIVNCSPTSALKCFRKDRILGLYK